MKFKLKLLAKPPPTQLRCHLMVFGHKNVPVILFPTSFEIVSNVHWYGVLFYYFSFFHRSSRCSMQKKKKAEDKQKLFILETHHPQIITDHILMYMMTLLYIFYTYIFKTRIGSYCIYWCTSSFLHFIKYLKIPHQYYFTKLFETANYSFFFLKLSGALRFLLSSPLLPLHTFPSKYNTIKKQQPSFDQHILTTFKQLPRRCIGFS